MASPHATEQVGALCGIIASPTTRVALALKRFRRIMPDGAPGDPRLYVQDGFVSPEGA